MATKQYKVTLSDDVADYLRSEDSRGRLSEGIDRLVHRVRIADTHRKPHHPQAKTFDLPDNEKPETDPRNPTGHAGTANRLAREDAVRAQYLANRRAGFKRICTEIGIGSIPEAHLPQYMEQYADDFTPDELWTVYEEVRADADGSVAKERREYWAALRAIQEQNDAEAANYKMLLAVGKTPAEAVQAMRPDQKPQTLRLSVKALRGLGMFGTPETMTDEQIRETNADWETREVPVDSDSPE